MTRVYKYKTLRGLLANQAGQITAENLFNNRRIYKTRRGWCSFELSEEATREAAEMFARCEGTLPAPESSHAIRVAIDEALKCKETGEKKVIVFGLTGTGYFDLTAYKAHRENTMTDYIPTDADLQKGFDSFPKIK